MIGEKEEEKKKEEKENVVYTKRLSRNAIT